jgi:hypothetical protein
VGLDLGEGLAPPPAAACRTELFTPVDCRLPPPSGGFSFLVSVFRRYLVNNIN